MINRFEQKRVMKMWRNKDIEAIKDHTARVTGNSERLVDVGDAPLKINIVELFRRR